jgi:succinate-semialdehyde dehydrogenase/glutarate-semialdehyde dehydrogenase
MLTQCGATLAAGGVALARPGNFFPPTLLLNAPDRSRLVREEPFGPVAPLASFKTLEEAVSRANSLPYGLASGARYRDHG